MPAPASRSTTLRVLHLRDTDRVCGPGKTIMETALATDRTRYDQLVGLFMDRQGDDNVYYRTATARGVEVIPVRAGGRFDPALVSQLLKVIKEQRIDLLHSHEYKSDIVAYLASRLHRMPIISTAHGFIQNSRRSRVMVGMGQRMLRSFDRVIAVSSETRRRLVACGIADARVRVIHNAIVTGNYDPRRFERGAFRAAFDIPRGVPLIGYVGRLSPEKGQRELLLAAPAVLQRVPEAHVVLVGDGPDEAALRELAATLGIGASVTFTGHIADPRPVFRDLDILALTSYTEGFPNVVLEALCMDVPVVASDVGGVPEIVEHGATGLLVPPRDPQAIAAALLQLLTDSDGAARLAAAGKRVVFDRFDFVNRVRTEERLYDEVLREWRAR